ncbi:MAG: cobalt-precorrin-5B (C(1))-methyltransferase CbiD [Leptolyngbyaceae cyanobacterium]
MQETPPRPGYTLPVFACAAAIAALHRLQQGCATTDAMVDLLEPSQVVQIPIEQVVGLNDRQAIALTRSDPGDNLDLTRHTPVWALVEWVDQEQPGPVTIVGGEGVGRLQQGQLSISTYARRLLQENLQRLLAPDQAIRVTVILPEGRKLAKRTANEAFGVVEGLSLLGTSGISQPLSAPGQLAAFRADLRDKGKQCPTLVFCLGENGLALAQSMGVNPTCLVKTANWLGPLLVEAGLQGVQHILLFGYHGKLIKLAGGIFHTHHHVADGRAEILTACCVVAGLPTQEAQHVFDSPTVEDGLRHLRHLDQTTGSTWVATIYQPIAERIDQRSQAYIHTHAERRVRVGTVLFDRQRQIIAKSVNGSILFEQVC